jgi:hypothetical protein
MMNGMRQQQASSQVDDLSQRADGLRDQQKDFEQRLKQAFGDGQQGRTGAQMRPGITQQRQLAEEKDKMAQAVDQLERDMQKAARDLAGTQPAASARVRDGLSDIQQNETKMRMQYSSRYIREGQGQLMVPREAPITQSLEQLSRDLKAAQAAVNPNAQPGSDKNGGMEQELARLERLRSQMQEMQQRAQQNGQGKQGGQGQQGGQNGQGKQGGQGQQGGQQQGQGQQGGGQQGGGQPGGQQAGGRLGGGFGNGLGRFQQEGIFEPNVGPGSMEPGNLVRDAQAQMNGLRDRVQGDPELSRDVQDLSRDLSRLSVGNTASEELEARIAREILPKLEALEVQLRRSAAETQSGQVRSGGADRVAPGYTDAVAEYFRKLSKGR